MTFDALVVGAGPAGATCALALAREGLEVCLADAQASSPGLPTSGFDLRVSAVNRASQQVLEQLGVWARMDAARFGVFRRMRVWDGAGRGEVGFDAADLGEAALGHIVENAQIVRALEAAVAESPRIHWRRPAELRALHTERGAVTARLDGEPVRARLLVGADGARSRVRELAELPVSQRSYEQTAVVSNLRMACAHEETAWQRFMPDGPLAVLPLPADYVSIVWTTTPEHAGELLALAAEAFNAAVATAFDHRLGDVVWSGERGQFPLHRVEATRYVTDRIALIGDAAHAIHPLAGQGLNLGLLDAATLAEVVGEAFRAGRDPGLRRVVRRYERWRKSHNLATQWAMDGFRWLFGERPEPVRILRNVGLGVTNALPPVKQLMAGLASGLRGDLPALARPPLTPLVER